MCTSGFYRIIVREPLAAEWAEWFSPMHIISGDINTVIEGTVFDQAMLHGILERIRNLNLTLLHVECIEQKGDTE